MKSGAFFFSLRTSVAISCLAASLIGCGTTVINGPGATSKLVGSIAVLPVQTKSDIQREKLSYIQQAFSRELSSSGYSVLSEQTINQVCSAPGCPEKDQLSKKYGVSNFLEITLTDSSQSNFLAGYYNAVGGIARLSDAFGKEIVSVEKTESEKGGLLLNSGQLLQAFKSASRGFEDSSHELADRFAKHIIENIPPPDKGEDVPSNIQVEVKKIEIIPFGDSGYRVCAEGSPGAAGRLIMNHTRYSLREIKKGTYCNVILAAFAAPRSEVSSVILESAFGVSIKKDFSLPDSAFCDPYTVVYKDSASTITVGCKEASGSCAEDVQSCKKSQFYVYKAESESGPFSKIGRIVGQSWKDTKNTNADGSVYTVLAISSDGAISTPIQVK